MAENFDVVIIGGGISGLSLAARLAGRMRVAVLEAEEHLGMHTSGRSAAMLVEAYGSPVIRRLTSRSRSFFEAPPAGLSEAPLSRRRGSLVFSGEENLDQLHTEFEAAASEVIWLETAAAIAACPLLKPEVVAAAFLEVNALDLDTDALLQGFARQARRAGAEIWTASPLQCATRSGDAWQVTAGGRTFSAGIIANAAGAWADVVASMAGAPRRGMQPMRRTAATIELPPELASRLPSVPLTMPVDESFYFKPEAGALMVSLSEEAPSDPCDAWADDLDVALALDRFHKATIVPPVRPTATRAGLRTFSPDRDPVVGFDTAAPGFFWYAGQAGYGFQTAPALSALGAKLILGDALDEVENEIAPILNPARLKALAA